MLVTYAHLASREAVVYLVQEISVFSPVEKPSGDDCQLTIASAGMRAEPMKLQQSHDFT